MTHCPETFDNVLSQLSFICSEAVTARFASRLQRPLEFREMYMIRSPHKADDSSKLPRARDDAPALPSRVTLGLGHWTRRSRPHKQSALLLRLVTSSENHWAGLLRAICFLLNVQTQMHTLATCFAITEANGTRLCLQQRAPHESTLCHSRPAPSVERNKTQTQKHEGGMSRIFCDFLFLYHVLDLDELGISSLFTY